MKNEMSLHGLLVGLGVEHKDGSKDFRWLDKPIHNRIVACGLDAYFQYNGSNSATTSTRAYGNRFLGFNDRQVGLLAYFGIGTGGTATRFDDTTLGSQVGGYSNEFSYTVTPYFGIRRNSDDSASIRVQSTSIAVDSTTTVREMGWFEKIATNTYVMFSRVVLDSPVTLSAGEKLLACYQIDLTFAGMTETEVPQGFLTGLLDSDGNQLRAFQSQRILVYQGATTGTWENGYDKTPTFPGIGYFYSHGIVGSNTNASQTGWYFVCPFFKEQNNPSINCCIGYSLRSDFALQAQWSASLSSQQYNCTVAGNNLESWNPLDYVPGTYYRDRKIVTSPAWPNLASGTQDIYAINYSNLLMRFGHFDENNQWVAKPWRKEFGKRYEFTYRLKLSTDDTP